jgi:hypothetical protein
MLAGFLLLVSQHWGRFRRDGGVGDAEPWLLVGVALMYSVAHLLTWTLVRYRLPVDALLLPMAALALVWLFDRVKSRAPVVRDEAVDRSRAMNGAADGVPLTPYGARRGRRYAD